MSEFTVPKPGASFGVGSLPHRESREAVEFAWRTTDIPTIPSLPRRSPAEGMIAQALVGIEGVSAGQYGSISVDVDALDLAGEVTTDLTSDAYGAFAEFLESAGTREAHPDFVKWQFVGPLTLGFSLVRSGMAVEVAAPMAMQAVRCHVRALQAEVAAVMPRTTQIVVFDEPMLHEALVPGFPVSPDEVIDFVSGALAAVEPGNISGVHSCAETDWTALLSMGAGVLSVPVPSASNEEQMKAMLAAAPRISEHLELGGRIAWGAIRTDGPIAVSADRPWKHLAGALCALVQHGVDPVLIRRHSFITPACGLGTHTPAVAERVMSHVRDITVRIAEQATASLLTLGS
ncbi:MAG: hypothetical protein RLZZ544_1277 [Actinomycetota bacterium]